MKLNKTLMIAALVAGSVFAADYAARAQDSTNTPPAGARPPGAPGARGRFNLDNIAKQLNLSDAQKEKAKPVFEDMQQKMMDLRKDTSVAPADRAPKMKEIRDEANTKLKEIFTPEQYDKWMKMSQGRRGAATPPPAGGTTTTPPAGGTTPPQQ